MEIFPKIILNKNTSKAEKLVFDFFKKSKLGSHYCAFHSLLLPRHRFKFIGESDFPVLTPHGFLIIEVKGGTISCDRGLWKVESKMGKIHQLHESPFEQAKYNMYSLMDKMIEASMPFRDHQNLKGFGIIFPDCWFDVDGEEIENDLIMDARALNTEDPIKQFIKRLENYWFSRQKKISRKFSSDEWHKIRNWLRPNFHGIKSLWSHRLLIDQELVSLVKEQMDFLETAQGKNKIICSGGAGTGKTLVGLEYARIKFIEDYKIIYVVPTALFRNYLKEKGYDEEWIISFRQLKDYPSNSIEIMAIDETQDLMTMDHFSEIDRVLINGIDEGNWLFLMDEKNQNKINSKFDTDLLSDLRAMADADIHLPRNIRNTIEIIKTTQELTGKDIGKRGTGPGRKIEYLMYSDVNQLSEDVSNRINDLIDGGIDPCDIAIVSSHNFSNNEYVHKVLKKGHKIKVVREQSTNLHQLNKVLYATTDNFKGMESYVVIVDLGEFSLDSFSKSPLYIAVTRPVGHLILLCPNNLRKAVGKIQLKNIRNFSVGGQA